MKHITLICALIVWTSIGFSGTIVVDLAGGGNFTNIHDAVDDANNGDTILVMSGLYLFNSANGSITVDQELHLIGSGYDSPENGGTTIEASTALFNFTANADGSTLEGFRMWGYGSPLINISADDMIIEGNHIRNSYNQGWAVNLASGVSSDTLRNNILGFSGGSYRPGIQVYQTTDVTVSNNVFYNCNWYGAVYVTGNTNAVVSNNLFVSTATGVYHANPSTATIVNNIFMNGVGGGTHQIYAGGGDPTIRNNCFFNNQSNSSTGIDPILANPDFVDFSENDTYNYLSYDDENFDFHLNTGATADSSCINTGYTLPGFNDLDGSQNDPGLYGWLWPMGTNGAPRMPVINHISVTPSGVAPGETISIEVIGRFGD